ncbi:hypothetical protein Prudu_016074 [Prunus dulcis]|uniref:Uncharacterized protein n=1 Tax=Prunus dulcis TaxID=3755 RepID=A0A4Y1RKH3_PRUDU|nr:hypothetical protein Prudu_016074 [Prunus dulcis]
MAAKREEARKPRLGMEKLKDHPDPSDKSKKVLYFCFSEYCLGTGNVYYIHAFDLEKNCHVLPLAESIEVGRTMGCAPVIMGSGVHSSKIILAGGIRPIFDGLANFIPNPCRRVLEFDTAIMKSHIPLSIQHHGDLQHGKTHPHVVEHRENLYVLSVLTGEGFEMFDPKYDKWVTLPETPFFHRRYRGHHTDSVVIGSNIFVSCLSSIYRFDMADSRQIWKEHSFTNCTALPYGWDEKTLALEMSDGDWLIFTCFPELSYDPHEIKDNPCCDDYDCNNSNMDDYLPYRHQLVPDRHFEWHGTSLPAYIMSKDFTSLTPIQPLRLPDDLLPNQPGCERLRDLYMAKPREIDYRIVHLGGQEICLVLSIDTGFEPNGRVLRKMPIFVASFEFQLSDSKDVLTIKTGSSSVQCFLLGAHSSATKLSMCGAFWL